MTVIALPQDLEHRLADEARRRGTTPELLALAELRRLFPPELPTEEPAKAANLLELLIEHVGAVDGSCEPFSENCGARFAEGLGQKQRGQCDVD